MAAGIGGMGGAIGIGASAASASSAAVGSIVGEVPDEAADIQAAIWSPTKLDGQALNDLLQAMQPQSPAAAAPTSFGP